MTMSNGDLSIIDNNENNTNQLLRVESKDRIKVHLKYNDFKENFEKFFSNVEVLSTATIHDVIVELIKLLHLENIHPENVEFVGLKQDQYYSVVLENKHMTLQALRIDNDNVLSFQPSDRSTSEQPFCLTIWFSGKFDRIDFKWYRNVTTLGMLLEYVIEHFSLESIPRERVHLFLGSIEFDVASDYDKLLKDLNVIDRTICEVEIIPPISDSMTSSKKISSNDFSSPIIRSTESSESITLKLEYTDHFLNIKKTMQYPFLRTTTINKLMEQLPQLFNLQEKRPEDIEPIGFGYCNPVCTISEADRTKPLTKLIIRDGDTIFFGPSFDISSKEPYSLTIQFLDKHPNKNYEWDKKTTTLGMLMNHIIKEFSLRSIDRNRIQLINGYSNVEFDHRSQADQLLDSFGIKNHHLITVKVLPLKSSFDEDYSPNVRVDCAFLRGMKTLHVSNTITIGDLKDQIEKQFEDSMITDLKLFDRMHNAIETNNLTKTLSDFGVEPHQVVYASVHLVYSRNSSSEFNNRTTTFNRTLSLIAKDQPDDVTIIGISPLDESIKIKMSVHDTVNELNKKLEIFKTNRSSPRFKITSGSNIINCENLDRRLKDFGIVPDDIIHVELLENTVKRYELEKSQGSSLTNYRFSSPSPVGLVNMGNTCYMNSALQCLAHVKPLTKFFLDGLSESVSEDERYSEAQWNQFYTIGSVTGAYADVLKNLWKPNKSLFSFSSFRPDHIKETIGLQAPRFATHDQQDAQEFMTHLLDEIHKELKEKNGQESITIIEELFFGSLESTITCQVCQHQTKTTNIISFLPLPLCHQGSVFNITFISKDGSTDFATVHVPIDGQVKNIIEAFANSRTSYYFWNTIVAMADNEQVDIEMPVNQLSSKELMLIEQDDHIGSLSFAQLYNTSRSLTLESCLHEFCSTEILEDSWLCQQETCKKQTTVTKQLQLTSLPSILIIQLKRFSHNDGLRHKIDTFVEFPTDELNLTSLLPSTSEEIIYDLFAVTNHIGSIHGGHYIACACHEINGKYEWYKFDDAFTSSYCPRSDIVSKNAYLLFYMRRDKNINSM